MLRFAADECLNLNIVDELRRRNPDIDVVTVQERNLRGQPDSVILEWAASEGRILLTRDANSLCGLAYQRYGTENRRRASSSCPGHTQ